ncbi:uncharacterized protein LOC114928115 isoform X1 [Nylanderia fulva]|uniref:uncharacterized protein LOC114928115 isoform X1 n=1 Tax=Nylanderia fulva TaxID=613905 RepID=UPI0010FAE5B6|nr:uncharacterized protein LOC114928115 isoform X1 [Nylanderia fulva]
MEVEKRDGATRSAVLGTRKPSAWPACLPACPVCLPASLPVSQPASQPASHPKFPSSARRNVERITIRIPAKRADCGFPRAKLRALQRDESIKVSARPYLAIIYLHAKWRVLMARYRRFGRPYRPQDLSGRSRGVKMANGPESEINKVPPEGLEIPEGKREREREREAAARRLCRRTIAVT